MSPTVKVASTTTSVDYAMMISESLMAIADLKIAIYRKKDAQFTMLDAEDAKKGIPTTSFNASTPVLSQGVKLPTANTVLRITSATLVLEDMTLKETQQQTKPNASKENAK